MMSKRVKGLHHRLLIISILLFFFSCKEPIPPEYLGIENIIVNDVNSDKAVLHGDVILNSEEKRTWNIKDVNIDIYNDNDIAGNLYMNENVKIKYGRNSVPVILSIDLKKIGKLNSILSLLASKSVTLNLKGEIKVGKSIYNKSLPVDEIVKIQL
ncbi:hypothetical protein [Marinigracilibium pacificum]|uniref:Late embryogenesis abundant protein LEA-2 subgroup domain-containing protein n=1 Tax=Marinigracilibium pacificum TaxID=2729599 RepID=A0A848IS22_9BACT|nr:hypothetical protein [Marinigracilibium pacificum]NMM47253.1 hypothetical protein [Marinigracilibium pacificum]